MFQQLYLGALFFLLVSTPLWAKPKDFQFYGPHMNASYQLSLANFLEANRLTLTELRTWIAESKSYEEFLDFLGERRPQLFQNYVLVHDTGSIQYADQERPRVILFGDGLMLAFAEDPRTPDRTVELIAFNETTWKFEFEEIRFKQSSSQWVHAPSHCQSCHGTSLKPLWEPYDFWPNIYGSSIARFGSAMEKAGYERLRLADKKEGIYRRLAWYLPPVNNNSGLPGIEAFTEYVTQLQLMVAMKSWQGPRVKPFLPALLAVWNGCTQGADGSSSAALLEEYFPVSWQGKISAELSTLQKTTIQERDQFKAYQERRYQQLFPNVPRTFTVNHQRLADETQSASQAKILLREMGLDVRDLVLSQGANPYLLSVPSNTEADAATAMQVLAPELFQSLKPQLLQLDSSGFGWARFNCDGLKTKSLDALKNLLPLSLRKASKPAPTVFGECIRCHVLDHEKTGAPGLPFDRTRELTSYLKANGGEGLQKILSRIQTVGPGQMPPNRVLSEAEKADFITNMRTLLQSEPD